MLDEIAIPYRTNSIISVSGIKYNISLKLPSLMIAILTEENSSATTALSQKGWQIFNFEDSLNESYFSNLKSVIGI